MNAVEFTIEQFANPNREKVTLALFYCLDLALHGTVSVPDHEDLSQSKTFKQWYALRTHMKHLLAVWHKESVRKDDEDLDGGVQPSNGVIGGEELQQLLDMFVQDKLLIKTMVTFLSKNDIDFEDDAGLSRTHAALAASLAQVWKEPSFQRERFLAIEADDITTCLKRMFDDLYKIINAHIAADKIVKPTFLLYGAMMASVGDGKDDPAQFDGLLESFHSWRHRFPVSSKGRC